MTPFSPMALSNLNNPYSPQPATPLGSTSGEEMFNIGSNTYIMETSNNVTTVTNLDEQLADQNAPMDDGRSRHSSAESDPNHVRSAPLSPHIGGHQHNSYGFEVGNNGGGGGHNQQRLRHQSAGNPPNPALAQLKTPDWMQDPTLTFATCDDLQEAMFDHRRSQSVPIVQLPVTTDGMDYFPASFLETDSRKPGDDDIILLPTSTTSGGVTVTNSNPATASASNDDLDLTLSALKDCDNDFSKFVQEVENNGTK
jgi:hypothetical protein